MSPVGPPNIYPYNSILKRDKINLLINLGRFKKEQKLSKKGFTLPELLIAAAIFAFAMSGILVMFINCAFLDQANRNKSIATIHAEFVMEDIMEYMRKNEDLDPLSSLQEEIGLGTWNWDYDAIESKCSTVLNSESITTSYSDDDEEDQTNPLEITVKVSWEAQAKTRSLELKTLILKR